MTAHNQLGTSKHNGLAAWRERQKEERQLRLLELEHYRSYATTEVRDGQEFTLVKIPDRYDSVERVEPAVQFRRNRKRT